jgi:uncharacterized protein (UPF0262 family)
MSGDGEDRPDDRLFDVVLIEDGLAPANHDIAHERRIAVFDLKERNAFAVDGVARGPYLLTISLRDGRLGLAAASADGAEVAAHQVSLAPMRRLIRDYFMVCESYYAAIKDATPMQIEAVDMGRRGLHNEGADLLTQSLKGKFTVDFETARRLFTLLCALHQRS